MLLKTLRQSGYVFFLLAINPVVMAELYTWTDEHGNTHFSDSKPGTDGTAAIGTYNKSPSTRIAKDFLGTRYAAKQTPIANSGGLGVRPVELTRVIIDTSSFYSDKPYARIGKQHYGKLCEKKGSNYRFYEGQGRWVSTEIRRLLPGIMQQYGYSAYGSRAAVKHSSLTHFPDLQLSVTIRDAQTNSCSKRVLGRYKTDVSSSYLASWTLYDASTESEIYTTETSGYDKALYTNRSGAINRPDESLSNSNSLKMLIGNLLADKQFVAKLKK